MDHAAAYQQSRTRLIDLAGDLGNDEIVTIVPATPAWTVQDTYAHLVGAAEDVLAGATEGLGTDAWTQSHVDRRRSASMASILDDWRSVAPDFEATIAAAPDRLWRVVAGTWLHEQDVRAAIGLRGLRHTDGGEVALRMVDGIGERIAAAGLAALRIEAADRSWLLGEGDVAAMLRVDPYELSRAVGGRRSRVQMAAMNWTGDGTAFLDVISAYGIPADDLID
jgi:uncharacterized protein (TIGR03083 family)